MASKSTRRPAFKSAEELVVRRKAVRLWWEGTSSKRPAELFGFALSGGGIRSATFSLGLIQGLAKNRDALSNIDIISSVSGGGYVACFLRSLFMPNAGRGILPKGGRQALQKGEIELDPADVADQYEFARTVLASGANVKNIPWREPVVRRNPLWWLREHSRFLAPNGPTDYGYALAYITRNWLAMLYIFLLASLALFSAVVLLEAGVASSGALTIDWSWLGLGASQDQQLACGKCIRGTDRLLPLSPIALVAVVPILGALICSIAYWMTQAMSPNEPNYRRQWKNLGLATGATAIAAIIIIGLAEWITPGALQPRLEAFALRPPGTLLVWILTIGLVLTVLGAVTTLALAILISYRGVALTSELRRKLTVGLASWNLAFLVILAIALIDSLGAGTAYWLRQPFGPTFSAFGAATLPALAYFIKKLPDWFGSPGKSSVATLLQRFMSSVALIAGILLFGMLAVAASAVVHLIAWDGPAWITDPDWPHLLLFVGVVWVLAVLSGTANGFINLSSLHLLYATRLTRAYLGATNNERLEAAAAPGTKGNITESHKADYIQPQLYSRADLPAPIHVINATINETIDPQSQLVARDRKGNVLSLEPGGIRAGEDFIRWDKVGEPGCAEQLSLGQWCAISGAAASSGMGRLTNLGFALAFTFANVRLGYWWWSPGVCAGESVATWSERFVSRFFGTFVYLMNEMTARYSRTYQRKYLTDGGHFENTGAYRLIQRKVPLILVTDNGADPNYRFEDFENLARKVRLDLGAELDLLSGAELAAFLKKLGAADHRIFVDPADLSDWRSAFVSSETSAFVLVVRITIDAEQLHMIWLKPRTLHGMPADLVGYSSANPSFPQQPTGDQFFDEAQWESYRKLGEICMDRLLNHCPKLLLKA